MANQRQAIPPRSRAVRVSALVMGFVLLLTSGAFALFIAHRSAARAASDAHHLEAAQHHLDVLLKVQPQNRVLRFAAARIARRRGDFDRAAKDLAMVASKSPNAADVQFEQRLTLAQRGDLQVVERGLRGLVAQGHPDALLIQEALAAGYLASGRLHESQAVLEEMLRKEPRHAPALLMLGQVFASLGRDDEAVGYFRAAVQSDPASSAAHLALAKALMLQGFEREAAAHLEWVHGRRPHDPDVLLALAEYKSDAGEHDAAERLLDDLLQHHKDHPSGLTERARLALRHDQAARAEEMCRRALTVDPTNALAWQVMANALHAQGREAEAARALDNHCVFDGAAQQLRYLAGDMEERPDDPDVYVKVAIAYLRLQQPSKAEDYVQRALALDEENAAARQLLQQFGRQER